MKNKSKVRQSQVVTHNVPGFLNGLNGVSENKKGYPNHVQGNLNKCVRMKWTTETRYQGDAELGAWQNDHCTNNQLPYICSHEQDP